MGSSGVLAACVYFGVAAIVFYFGYRIRVFGDMHLIAGYDPAETRDPVGLAKWIGGWAMGLGVAVLIVGVALLASPTMVTVVTSAFSVGVILVVVAMMLGARRFLR